MDFLLKINSTSHPCMLRSAICNKKHQLTHHGIPSGYNTINFKKCIKSDSNNIHLLLRTESIWLKLIIIFYCQSVERASPEVVH